MAPYKGTKLVTYHRSWPNFMERFGLDVIGYVEPKPGIPPSPSHTLELIDEMKAQGVKLIVVEPYFDSEDAAVDRQPGGRPRAACWRRRSAARRKRPTTSSCSTTTSAQLAGSAQADHRKVGRRGPRTSCSSSRRRSSPALIIAGIHAYLGLHVVERGVIFVDLSLAQIASLGAAIAVWQGYDAARSRHLLDEPGVHAHRRAHLRDGQGTRGAHPAGSHHRHLVRRGLGGGDPDDEQGDR